MYLNGEGVMLGKGLIGQEIKSKINHVCSQSKMADAATTNKLFRLSSSRLHSSGSISSLYNNMTALIIIILYRYSPS